MGIETERRAGLAQCLFAKALKQPHRHAIPAQAIAFRRIVRDDQLFWLLIAIHFRQTRFINQSAFTQGV